MASAWRKRIVKVFPYGADSLKTVTNSGSTFQLHAIAGDTLKFQFPHGVIDLSTLLLPFRWIRVHPNANEVQPRDLECLIDELEVSLGDTVVNKISNYAQLFFIHSTYAMSPSWLPGCGDLQRGLSNRRANATVVNWLTNYPMLMEKFLGFLGCGKVIDTRKLGKLTVRIRLADSAAVNHSVAAATWGMLDPAFRVHYLSDNAPSDERISFDDFTSIRMGSRSYNARTTLIVDGRRKIDYVLARQVPTASHDTKQTVTIDNGVGLSQRFVSETNNFSMWELSVNNMPLHAFDPAAIDGYYALTRDVFPDGWYNVNTSANPTPENAYNKAWACGARLDLPQREDGQQNEITFETVASSSGLSVPVYSWIWAKTTSTVDATGGSMELIL